MTPLLVIDGRMVGKIPHGIARYVIELAKGLATLKKEKGLTYEPLFLTRPGIQSDVFSSFRTVEVSTPFLNPKEIFELPRVLKNLKATLYHSPSFSSLWSCPCPSIVTIHDLNHLTYGSWSQKIYYQTLLKRFAHRSSSVVTVSEFSRKELGEWLGISPEKIEVVYNSIDPTQLSPPDSKTSDFVLKKLGLEPGKYFFSLSNPKPHKNLPFLIQAYGTFHKQKPQAWPLVLTIDQEPPVEGVRAIGGQTETEVNALLTYAGGCLFPSLYEGFGLPPVEAAVLGAPLAVSRIPPHEEGLSSLLPHELLWVGPSDFHGWVNAFHRLSQGMIPSVSQSSRQKILDRSNARTMGQNMDRIYRHVLKVGT